MQNLIEPRALVDHFVAHPPVAFEAVSIGGSPGFVCQFDLFTTVSGWLRRCLPAIRARTLFVGTTVTEYAVFEGGSPELTAERIARASRDYAFAVVKDLPEDPVLVGVDAFRWSQLLIDSLRRHGFILMEGQALAYLPLDFDDPEELLASMSRARRKNIRRKLRSRAKIEVEEVCSGADIFANDAFIAELYALYRNVYDQSEVHFDLLAEGFFAAVLRDRSSNARVMLYRHDNRITGFNLCVFGDGVYVDKYVGFRYPEARQLDLYVVSWFHNLRRAKQDGLRYYIAGWTDPEIKRALGARFTWTRHAVFIRNPLLRRIAAAVRPLLESDRRWYARHDHS